MDLLKNIVAKITKPERSKLAIWFAQLKGWREDLHTLRTNHLRTRNHIMGQRHSDIRYFVRFPYLDETEFSRWRVVSDYSFDCGFSRAELVRSPRLPAGATPNFALPHSDTMEGSPYIRDGAPLAARIPGISINVSSESKNAFLRTDPIDRNKRTLDASRRNGVITSALDSKTGRGSEIFSGGYALFRGYISTKIPDKGNIDRAGFASLMSPIRTLVGFTNSYRIFGFTHIILRFRGDGRTYRLNFQQNNPWEIFANDLHQYYLHTTGGPHWQIAKIPLSKFYLSNRRQIPERQYSLSKQSIKRLTFTLMDDISGPFSLEIDYIGFYKDNYEKEEFVYEKYKK